MEFSEEQKRGVEKQFDAYCRKVLHRKACSCFAELARKTEHEKSLGDLSGLKMEELATQDVYPSFFTMFYVPGYGIDVLVENEGIAKAVTELDPNKRDVVLLYYFMNLRDREIAEMLHLVRSTVAYRRMRALKVMKSVLDEWKGSEE